MKRNTLGSLQTALAHQNVGRLAEAETLYRAVLKAEPANADALNLLGVLEHSRGRHREAADWIAKAIKSSPKTASFHNNLGLVLTALGRLPEAAPCFQTAARLEPGLRDAHFNLGVVLHGLGQIDAAIAAYEKALALGKEPGTLNNLGAAYRQRHDYSKAIQCFQEALRIQPDFADALLNLADTLLRGGQPAAAIPFFELRARLPNPPPALASQLALAMQQSGRSADAEKWYRQALQTQREAQTCLNLAVLLEQRFDFVEAEQLLRQALDMQPDYAEAFNNLGNVLLATGRPEEAELAYGQAITLRPDFADAFYNRGQARLTLGDFAGGWADYERRWDWKGFPHKRPGFPQPEWTGDELAGRTLLVYNEQGLGDTIQFARYLAMAAAGGGRVVFTCPEELRTLLRDLPGQVQVLETDEPLPVFDVHAALMSLPRICGTTPDTIPAHVPYLAVPPAERFALPERTPGRLRVGINWAGGRKYPKDALRSLSLQHFIRLLGNSDCEFFSLQAGPKAAELVALPDGMRVADIGSRVRDFADTAAVMGQLDLIISTCTATLHLAGALARPVWGLLGYAPDWRWMLGREDSPWYPTMRLFRQKTPGDWQGVFDRVEAELARVAARHRESGEAPKTTWFLPAAPARADESIGWAEFPSPRSSPQGERGPPREQQIFMSGQTTGGFGWGVVNRGLFEELSKRIKTTLIGPADPRFLSPKLPGALLTTLLGLDFIPECPARGRLNLANAVFEQELTARSVENAKRFDVVFAASNWCLERMGEKGMRNGALLLQGINTQTFRPAAGEKKDGGFRLFSGGKFELRKGQDLVLKAFRVLSQKFPDMSLLTAWHNLWPQSLQTMAGSPHIRFELRGGAWPEQLAHLCAINGIDPKRVVAIKPSGPAEMAQVYRSADLGLFPNRCEGATNLVLMEFMACGKPAIVSFNSGHRDVATDRNAILLKNQRDLEIKGSGGQLAARWQEVAVDEIIASVEHAYHHREELQAVGNAAAADLAHWDWSRSAEVVLGTIAQAS